MKSWIVAAMATYAGVASAAVTVRRETVVGGLDEAVAVAMTAGERLVVADRGRGVVERFTRAGRPVGETVEYQGVNDLALVRGVALTGRPKVLIAGSQGILGVGGTGYTGVTVGSAGGGRVYAADFHARAVYVFDREFDIGPVVGFNDETIPAEYSPHKIEKLGDRLYVAYARQDARGDLRTGKGTGFVDVFDGDGVLRRRLVTNKKLNAPSGMALGPDWMGDFAGDLLVANAGDGTISAYDRATGDFEGQVRNVNGVVVRIDGLTDVFARNGELYVTSERGVERLVGIESASAKASERAAAVPEPGGVVSLFAMALALSRRRHHGRSMRRK